MLFQYLVLSSDFNVDSKNFKFVFFKIYIFSSRIKKMDLINNMTVNSHFHLFNHLENLLMLNKKECKLTLYSQNAFRKQPLHFAIHSNKLYENYNINQYNESYATIQKKKPRYAPINHQIFFVSYNSLLTCLLPSHMVKNNGNIVLISLIIVSFKF